MALKGKCTFLVKAMDTTDQRLPLVHSRTAFMLTGFYEISA